MSSLNSSDEELMQRFRRGTACFSDKVYVDTSEQAKAFVLNMLRPAAFKKQSKIQPCIEVALHMSHQWFSEMDNNAFRFNAPYGIIVMRKYDTWRNTLRLRTNFVKILADHMCLSKISHLWMKFGAMADGSGKVSWVTMVPQLLENCPILHLLQKVNKAFGENEELPVIHLRDTRRVIEAWRRKRVRETLWQVFNRTKAFDGVMPADACREGLGSAVLHVWSRPLRVIDIIFPADGQGEPDARIDELIGSAKSVSFLDLVAKTDAADPA